MTRYLYLAVLRFSFLQSQSLYYILFFLFLHFSLKLMRTWHLQTNSFLRNCFQDTTIVRIIMRFHSFTSYHYTESRRFIDRFASWFESETHTFPRQWWPTSLSCLRLINVFRGVNGTRTLTSSLSTTGVRRSRIPRRVACSRTRIIECWYEVCLRRACIDN